MTTVRPRTVRAAIRNELSCSIRSSGSARAASSDLTMTPAEAASRERRRLWSTNKLRRSERPLVAIARLLGHPTRNNVVGADRELQALKIETHERPLRKKRDCATGDSPAANSRSDHVGDLAGRDLACLSRTHKEHNLTRYSPISTCAIARSSNFLRASGFRGSEPGPPTRLRQRIDSRGRLGVLTRRVRSGEVGLDERPEQEANSRPAAERGTEQPLE
jgi:hypothetical protein